MFLKCSKAADNIMVFLVSSVPFHKAFWKGWGTSQRNHMHPGILLVPPSWGQMLITTKPTQGRTAALLCVSSAQGPHREQMAVSRSTWGKGEIRKGPPSPWLWEALQEGLFRGWVVQRQKTGTLLEVRKGKKIICLERDFPAPGFKSTSQASSQKLCLLMCS